MSTIDNLMSELPDPVRQTGIQVWEALPPDRQGEVDAALAMLPGSLKPLKDVLGFVLDRYKPAFGTKRGVAIVGPANVGKSTLYNKLIAHKEDVAEVGPVPGTTRENQKADTGLFLVVDTPGADAVGMVGQKEREIAFQAAEQADFLVIVFEASRGIKRYERDLYDALLDLNRPYIVVLNKIDLIPKQERERVIESAASNLSLLPAQIIATVATKGTNVDQVILGIVKLEPALLAAIAEALPEYQHRLAWQQIGAAASSAGVVGFIPLPIADLGPLFLIQAGLVLSIARVYGFKITLARAKELLATFGAGILARTVYQQLSKLLGAPGWVLSAAIAAATTVAVGYGAMMWFAYGEKPSRKQLQRLTSEVAQGLRDRLVGLGKKRPKKEKVRGSIVAALKDMPGRLRPGTASPDEEEEGQVVQLAVPLRAQEIEQDSNE